MREFETTFIVQPEISDEGCHALFQRLDTTLERGGAVRLLFDDQGKRKLAYDIQKFQKGRYVTLTYFDSGNTIPEIERLLRLDESVLRFLTVRVADDVADIEGRKKSAELEEKDRAARAAERAAREAEERAARAAAGEVDEAGEGRSRDETPDDEDEERGLAAPVDEVEDE